MTSVPRIEFRPGYEVSRLVRGGWQLSGDHGDVVPQRAIADMVDFYDAGITTFDCADIYTGVEELYGAALKHIADERGQDAASTIRIHTKYVPDYESLGRLNKIDVRRIIERSAQRLGRERLDLVQFHWWDYNIPGCLDAVATLAELSEEGLIDRIGVTNFDRKHLVQIVEQVDLVSAQVQFSLLDRRPTGAFAAAAKDHGVHLICYGALAGGFLTDRWLHRPDPGFDFENRSLIKYRLIIEEFGGWDLFQELLNTLRAIADRHDADIAAVSVRAMLDHPDASAVIVGARYARHLPRLLKSLQVSLDGADRSAIAEVQTRSSGPNGCVYNLERDKEGRHGRIMKYNLNDVA